VYYQNGHQDLVIYCAIMKTDALFSVQRAQLPVELKCGPTCVCLYLRMHLLLQSDCMFLCLSK